MIKIILTSLFIIVTACSTSEKENYEAESEIVAGVPDQDSSHLPPTKSEKQASKKIETNGQNSLIDAIKSGSDEVIYKSATQALVTNSSDTKALMAMGMYHYRKNRPLMALYFYSKITALKNSTSELYNNIGLAHLSLKDTKEAIRSFRKAFEINPQDLNAAGNLSSLYLQFKDYSKAYIILDSAMKKGTKDVRLLTNFAIANAAKGKIEQAESLYQDVFRQNQNYKEGLYNFAVLQIHYQKKYKEGLETISKLKFLGPGENMKSNIFALEKRANAGLK